MENYTKIENDILENLYSAGLNGSEWDCIMIVFRKTNGFHKKIDGISITQFQNLSRKSRPSICKAIKELKRKNILILEQSGKSKKTFSKYSINIDTRTWQLVKEPLLVRETQLVKKTNSTSKENDTQLVKKTIHTKENITKENIQKKIVSKDTNSVVQKRNVQLIIYFKEKLGTELDGTNEENWRYCTHTWNKLRRMYPDKDTDEGVRLLIDASLTDDFHSQNATNFKYIFRNITKIVRSVAEQNKKKKSKIAFI